MVEEPPGGGGGGGGDAVVVPLALFESTDRLGTSSAVLMAK